MDIITLDQIVSLSLYLEMARLFLLDKYNIASPDSDPAPFKIYRTSGEKIWN